MDKESYQPMTIGHVAKRGIKEEFSSPFLLDPTMEKGRAYIFFLNGGFLERESATSV